jgi:hypothetical protein
MQVPGKATTSENAIATRLVTEIALDRITTDERHRLRIPVYP